MSIRARRTMPPAFRVLIVDDERLARARLVRLLRRRDDVEIVGVACDGDEAVQMIAELRPDLVFLDVQMPGLSGFDVLDAIDSRTNVVFTTAFDQYALRAFEVHALDYLLKPFDDARFRLALHRAKDKLAHYGPQESRPAQRLVVRSPGRLLFVNVSEIDWIEAASYYACLHVGRETHIIRRTLTELERDLGEATFIRIHRSIIVNLERIEGLELESSGEYEVVLKSKVRLRLSRRFRKRLHERLKISPSSPAEPGRRR